MKDSKMIFNQITQLTSDLISISLCDDQNYPVLRGTLDSCSIDIDAPDVSIALKGIPYREMYEEMCRKRSFNIKMIDGALLLLQYKVENGIVFEEVLKTIAWETLSNGSEELFQRS